MKKVVLALVLLCLGVVLGQGNTDLSRVVELKQFSHINFVRSVAFSPDGQTLATGSGDWTALIWDVSSGTELKRFSGHTNVVTSVAFSPNGQILATGSYDKTARVWDVSSGTELKRFSGHTSYVRSVAFSPDGQTLATGSGDKTARVYGTPDLQPIFDISKQVKNGTLNIVAPANARILINNQSGSSSQTLAVGTYTV